MNYHIWEGSKEEYLYLESQLGKDNLKPVPSIDWKTRTARVLDTRRGHFVRVVKGSVICWEGKEIWVE